MATSAEFISGRRYGERITIRDEEYDYEPRIRNGRSRDPGVKQIIFSLPKPTRRLEYLYRKCVEAYAEFGGDAFHPRFRELYDDFMRTLILSQVDGFDIRGYTELCAEDLFKRDIFAQRWEHARHLSNGGNGENE